MLTTLKKYKPLLRSDKPLRLEIERLKKQLDEHQRLWQGLDSVPFTQVSEEAARYPSMFINTLPKSGSVFLARSLQQSMQMEFQKLGYGYYPEDLVDYNKAANFGRGGRIGQEHFDASAKNLKLLELFVKRWVLHLRDPRASMLSWIHHLDRLQSEGSTETVQFSDPFLPQDYFQWDMSKKIGWQIDHYLPQSVAWISGWWEYYAKHPERMLVTSYKDLQGDSKALLEKILAYYGVRPAEVKMRDKTMASHFRKGEIGEWKTVLSAVQQQKAAAVCEALWDTFPDLDYLED